MAVDQKFEVESKRSLYEQRKNWELWINGRHTPALSGKEFPTINPATGSVIAHISEAAKEDVDVAVSAARSAYENPGWRNLSPTGRATVLKRVARLIGERAEALALLESIDNGKSIRETRKQMAASAEYFDYYASMIDKLHGRTIPVGSNFFNFTRHEPFGVVGCILPWNSPLPIACQKLAPALAAGNSVILKPSEYTPLTTLALAEIASEAGVPDGVVNVLPGMGPIAGSALAGHPGIAKISFTGSPEIARRIAADAAQTVKPLCLELGGKSPNIVFDDALLDLAVDGSVWGIFEGLGQSCIAASRLFVHDAVYDKFMNLFLEKIRTLKVGLPQDPETELGAITTKAQLEKIEHYVNLGREEGAELLIGGARPSDPKLQNGLFYQPTVFADVENNMRVAQNEIFGPVVCVQRFRDEEDVIRRANDTRYGLAGAVWTENIRRGLRVAFAIEAGTVWVNTYKVRFISSPLGGYKMSGYGKEKGFEGIEEYCQVKSVYVNMSSESSGAGALAAGYRA